jgi:hypothetical protein
MKTTSIFTILFFSLAFNIQAQYWQGNFPGTFKNGFRNSPFNSIVSISSNGFIRLNTAGSQLTNKRYTLGFATPTANAIYSTSFNQLLKVNGTTENYAVLGDITQTLSTGISRKYPTFLKLTASGTSSLERYYSVSGIDNLSFSAADIDPVSGEYYVAGAAVSNTTQTSRLYYAKLNASGVVINSSISQILREGVETGVEPTDLLVDGNNIYIIGSAFNSVANQAFIIQIDKLTGNITRRFRLNFAAAPGFTGINVYTLNAIKKAADGKFYLAGYVKPSGTATTAPRPLLMKVDLTASTTAAPVIVWSKYYTISPNPATSFYEATDVDEAGSIIYLSVRTHSSPLNEGKVIIRLNNAGSSINSVAYNTLSGGGLINSIDANSSPSELLIFGAGASQGYIAKARLDLTIPNSPNCPVTTYGVQSSNIGLTFVGLTHSTTQANTSRISLTISNVNLFGGICASAAARLSDESEDFSELENGLSNSNNDFIVFPNPVNKNEELTVRINNEESLGLIEMFDLSGRKVENLDIRRNSNSEVKLNTSNLTTGMYYLIATVNNLKVSRRIAIK